MFGYKLVKQEALISIIKELNDLSNDVKRRDYEIKRLKYELLKKKGNR